MSDWTGGGGSTKFGCALIRWRLMAQEVKEFTQDRKEEIEVYRLHCKGTEGKTAKETLSAVRWWRDHSYRVE